jgi:CDP-glycerol glycerophosphotransferase
MSTAAENCAVPPPDAAVLAPTAPAPAAWSDAVLQRLEGLEAFDQQVSTAVDQLVDGLLALQSQSLPEATAQAVQRAVDTALIQALQTVVPLQVDAIVRDATGPLLAALKSSHDAFESVKVKLTEVEQALNLERAGRDLADVSRMHRKTRSVVFVGNTYFGDNLKYAWLAARRAAAQHGFECWFLPHNDAQERLVRDLGERCLPAAWAQWGPEELTCALSAAVVVTCDHLLHPNPFALPLLAGARQVQLWHGVSIKEIGLRNLPALRGMNPRVARVLRTTGHYASLVGTAAAGEDEWRRWFGFERYAPIGYPRNDVLYRDPTPDDLLNVDTAAYQRACDALRQGRRVVYYAPTFRDANPRWMLDAGLARVAEALRERGDELIVNLHPVEQPLVPELRKALPHVGFVEPRTDAYPLLRCSSMLVTDYSSVMFDYLHLDRPIVLFRPDHADYVNRSRRLFDDKLQVLPGPMAASADELLTLTLPRPRAGDPFAGVRRALLARWFDQHDAHSGERFVALMLGELERAGAGAS